MMFLLFFSTPGGSVLWDGARKLSISEFGRTHCRLAQGERMGIFPTRETLNPMTSVCVLGLWHLGCVTAACLADAGFPTIGIDADVDCVSGLKDGRAPLFEPGLDDLIRQGMDRGRLAFSGDVKDAASCDLVWVALDTPVDDADVANTEVVYSAIEVCVSVPQRWRGFAHFVAAACRQHAHV